VTNAAAGRTRFYRRTPGAGWLAALIVVPLALGLIGSGGLDGADSSALPPPALRTSATPTPTPANGSHPTVVVAPLSLQRSGNDVVLSGQVPDELSRNFALDRARTVLTGTNVIDLLTVIDGITAVDLAGLDDVLTSSAALPDFGIDIEGGNVVLTGTAPSEAIATGMEDAVQAAWPDLEVVDDIAVITPGFAPPLAPPSPGLTGGCADLQPRISGLLRTPIQFDTDGSRVLDSSGPLLAQLADELQACPDARVSVTGHSDDTGTDSVNLSLSASRAKAVADALVSRGIRARLVTSKGVGAAEPIASNDSESGREQNRRIEITVS
jgi:peptidoglycan-binding protein ArfA